MKQRPDFKEIISVKRNRVQLVSYCPNAGITSFPNSEIAFLGSGPNGRQPLYV